MISDFLPVLDPAQFLSGAVGAVVVLVLGLLANRLRRRMVAAAIDRSLSKDAMADRAAMFDQIAQLRHELNELTGQVAKLTLFLVTHQIDPATGLRVDSTNGE